MGEREAFERIFKFAYSGYKEEDVELVRKGLDELESLRKLKSIIDKDSSLSRVIDEWDGAAHE